MTHASHSWYCGTQFHRYPIKSSFYIVVIASCVMHSTRYVTEAMCCSNYSWELTTAPSHTLHPPTPCTLPHPAPSHTLFLEVSLETNTCLVLTLVSVCQGIVHSQDWERGLTPAVEERSLTPSTTRERSHYQHCARGLAPNTARGLTLSTAEGFCTARGRAHSTARGHGHSTVRGLVLSTTKVSLLALWEVSFLALQEIIFLELQEVMLVALWEKPCS